MFTCVSASTIDTYRWAVTNPVSQLLCALRDHVSLFAGVAALEAGAGEDVNWALAFVDVLLAVVVAAHVARGVVPATSAICLQGAGYQSAQRRWQRASDAETHHWICCSRATAQSASGEWCVVRGTVICKVHRRSSGADLRYHGVINNGVGIHQ